MKQALYNAVLLVKIHAKQKTNEKPKYRRETHYLLTKTSIHETEVLSITDQRR